MRQPAEPRPEISLCFSATSIVCNCEMRFVLMRVFRLDVAQRLEGSAVTQAKPTIGPSGSGVGSLELNSPRRPESGKRVMSGE